MHRHLQRAAISGFVLCCASALPAAPVTLVNEDFSSSQQTQLQYFGFSGQTTTVDEGVLKIPYAESGRYATGNFTRTTLGVGDSLSLSFTLTADRTTAPSDFRIGLYDSLGTTPTDDSAASRAAAASDKGFLSILRDDPGNFYSGLTQTDVSGDTLEGESGGYHGVTNFADGQPHAVQLVYKYTTLHSFQIGVYFDNALRTTVNLQPDVLTFDNLQFGFGNRLLNNTQLDNLVLTYSVVPEPVAGGVGLAALLLGLRRSRP